MQTNAHTHNHTRSVAHIGPAMATATTNGENYGNSMCSLFVRCGINNINIIIMLFLSLDIHSFPFHLAGDNRIDLLFFVCLVQLLRCFCFFFLSTSLLIINLFLIQYSLRLVLNGRGPFLLNL